MKNAFNQLQLQFGKIELRHIQLVFMVFALAVMIVNQSPMDLGGGTR